MVQQVSMESLKLVSAEFTALLRVQAFAIGDDCCIRGVVLVQILIHHLCITCGDHLRVAIGGWLRKVLIFQGLEHLALRFILELIISCCLSLLLIYG